METTVKRRGRKAKGIDTMSMRIETGVVQRVKIAAAFAGVTVYEYACGVLETAAEKDIKAAAEREAGHANNHKAKS